MIPSLQIRNFRLFDNLVIDKLARVNLITGKNNVGKTALLEAVSIYSTNGSGINLFHILQNRNMNAYFDDKNLKNLFPFFSLSNKSSVQNEILIGQKELNDFVGIDFIGYTEIIENGKLQRFPFDLSLGGKLGIQIRNNKESRILSFGLAVTAELIKEYNRPFISSSTIDIGSFLEYWDEIVFTPSENDVIYCLKMIEPGIKRLALKGEKGGESRSFIADIEGYNNPIPIDSLGEGFTRMLRIIIGLVSAKDSILCIDEIENGLHYSVQQDMWKRVLEFSEKLNVQVFATTHSWDCIDAFQKALNEFHDPSAGQLIRLKEKNGTIGATVSDARELAIATRENIEVR